MECRRRREVRKFVSVRDFARKTPMEYIVQLPSRATERSMGYDFYANDNYVVHPNEVVKVWTDVKAYMGEDEGLILNIRSSMGGKWALINQQGWVDSDYVDNESNDGNIGFFLKNTTDKIQMISRGERIGQGMFVKYLVTDDDEPINKSRKGGFGSTN